MAEAEKARSRGAGETEKDLTARSAEPSARSTARRDEGRTIAQYRLSSQVLFDVPGYVLVGAAHAAGLDPESTYSESEVKKAVKDFLAREVK